MLTDQEKSLQTQEPRYYNIISGLFIAVLVISEVAAVKLFAWGPFVLPGAVIVFPVAYIFGDVLTEVYGYARARRIIWLGFFAEILLAAVLLIVQILPPAKSWPNQSAYESILGFIPRIVIGSIIAYWLGEFANSFVLAKMKIWTKGKMLWSRTIGSTIVGQAIDTAVFDAIAFSGLVPLKVVGVIFISHYLFKVAYEVLATPLTYLVVNFLKKSEGRDIYDHQTDFTPFKVG